MRNGVTLFKNYIIERRWKVIGKTSPSKATLKIYDTILTKRFANDSQFDVQRHDKDRTFSFINLVIQLISVLCCL